MVSLKSAGLRFAVSSCFLLGCGAAVSSAGAAEPQPHTLPGDPQAVVVELDYLGGMIARKSEEPYLKILADGTVKLSAPYGGTKPLESKISEENLQSLLTYILDEQKLGEFDPQAIGNAIRAKQQQGGPGGVKLLGSTILDAATTIVRVHADGKSYEAKYYALSMVADRNPDIVELGQLRAIEKRLQLGANIIHAGGTEGLKLRLEQVNAKLKAQHPDAAPLTVADLTSAQQRPDGSLRMQFRRQTKLLNGENQGVNATLTAPAEGEPEIQVFAFQAKSLRGGARIN